MPVDPSHPEQSEVNQAYPASEQPGETVTHSGEASDASADAGATTDYHPPGVPTAPGPLDATRRPETGSPIGAETQAYAGSSSQQAGDRPEGQQTGTETAWPPAPVEGDRTQPARDWGVAKAGSVVGRGRYLLKSFHAKGGMGEIWLAEDCDIGREVALKRMRPGHDRHKPRFTLEAQITGQLEHPGVVPVHEVGVGEDGQPFYVMKFVRGHTLEKAIKEYHARKPASDLPREVQQLRLLQSFVHLCHTIAYAHSRGVIHRDIKPDNVMLGAYNETQVLDWGIAKVMGQPESQDGFGSAPVRFSGETDLTRAGSVQGTPSYMAPEVAQGLNAEVDHRSDVYLLGSTLYQILTGKRPRKAANLSELLELARSTPPPPPRNFNPEIPRALDAICMKAMAHSKEARYQSAGALADDIQRYLAGEPVSAYPEPWLERAWRWTRKHRRGLSTAAAAVLVVALGLFAFAQVRQAKREAAQLKALEEARVQVSDFRRLADQTRFYLANVNPTAENAPYFEPDKGEGSGRAALAIAQNWGQALEELTLTEEQLSLKNELYDLLLLIVHGRVEQAVEAKDAEELIALLDQARKLRERSRSYYGLRSQCSRLAGRAEAAAQEQKQAEDNQAPTTALDHFLRGEELRRDAVREAKAPSRAKDWHPDRELIARAMEEYRQALKIAPDHYWSLFQLGRCYWSLAQWAESAELLSACIALRPQTSWGYNARAFALIQLRRYAEAEADLNTAIGLDPEQRPLRLARGIAYWQQKKEDAALKDFQAVLEPPNDKRLLEAAFYRAQLYLQRGQVQEALADFDRIVAERPDFYRAYQWRAFVRFALGKDAQGLDDLNAYLAREKPFDERSRDAHRKRGRLLRLIAADMDLIKDVPPAIRRSKLLLAAAELQKSIQLGEQSASVYDDLGAVLEQLGKNDDAIEAYSKGLELAPMDIKLLVKRGWVYAGSRQYEKARDDFAAAIAAQHDHAEAHAGLGYTQACRKSQAEALRQANLAVLRGGGDYLILHNVACIYAELAEGDPSRAKEYEDLALDQLQRAVELWERDRSALNEIKLIKGEPAFHKSLRARPEFLNLLLHHEG